jgi:hypothetical protein
MRRGRVAVVAVFCGTAALAVWGGARLAGFASPDFENTSRPLVEDREAISIPAEPIASPQATAMREDGVSVGDMATDADRTEPAVVLAALPVARVEIEAALPDASAVLPSEAPPVQMATANMPDPVQKEAKEPVSYIETLDECPVPEICIDRYLWSLYERAPKVDARKVVEQIKVTSRKTAKPTRSPKKLQITSRKISHGRIRRRQKKPACLQRIT